MEKNINKNNLLKQTSKIKNPQQIKGIIFDIGGVIVDYPVKIYYEELANKFNLNVSTIKTTIDPLRRQLELGNLSTQDFLKNISNKFKLPKSRLNWQQSFKDLMHTDNNMINLIQNLSENYNVYILSNISKTGFVICSKEFKKNNCKFDKKFASCYLHLRKPDPNIYLHVLKKVKLLPTEIVFIDDKQQNIDPAIAVGINGILFTNLNQLINDLKHLNIKITANLNK